MKKLLKKIRYDCYGMCGHSVEKYIVSEFINHTEWFWCPNCQKGTLHFGHLMIK